MFEPRTITWPATGELPLPELCHECDRAHAILGDIPFQLKGRVAVREGDRLIIHRRGPANSGQLGTACGKTFEEMSLANWAVPA